MGKKSTKGSRENVLVLGQNYRGSSNNEISPQMINRHSRSPLSSFLPDDTSCVESVCGEMLESLKKTCLPHTGLQLCVRDRTTHLRERRREGEETKDKRRRGKEEKRKRVV